MPDKKQDAGHPPRRRVWIWSLVLGLPPLLLLLDTFAAIPRGWAHYGIPALSRVAIVLFVLGAVLPFGVLIVPRGRRLMARIGPRLCLTAVAALGSLGLGEAVLRVTASGRNLHLRQPGLRAEFHPDPSLLPGIEGKSGFSVNALGVRGTEPPAEGAAVRVLCIGGSTTECLYLDDRETWPALVEEELNRGKGERFWVGNAGRSGFDTHHHLDLLADEEFIRRFDVLVFLTGFNDLARGLRGAPPGAEPVPLWQRLRMVEILKSAVLRRGVPQDREGKNYAGLRAKRKRAEKIGALPDLGPGLGLFEKALQDIVQTCEATGVRPVFVTQAVVWRPGLSDRVRDLCWFGDLPDGRYLTVEALRQGMDLYNAALAETAQAQGASVVDLSSLSGRTELFYDDCHFSEGGAREAARIIAEGLRKGKKR
jgi:lysophospholipase L1-like esterase